MNPSRSSSLPHHARSHPPKSHRSVTGLFPSRTNGGTVAYESTLERDFFFLCELDPSLGVHSKEQASHRSMDWEGAGREAIYGAIARRSIPEGARSPPTAGVPTAA